jgi:hypothetical protein
MTAPLRIVGLREFQADLRALDKTLPREIRVVNLSVAKMVRDKAVSKGVSQGGLAAKAAPTLKALAQQRSASIKLTATAAVPFALGAEFGAGHNIERQRKTGTYLGYNQFKEWRGAGAGSGYFLWPTVREQEDAIAQSYLTRLTELTNRVFPL